MIDVSREAFLYWVGMSAVAVNAMAAILEAERKQLDLVGAVFIAFAAGLAGGTFRDVLLDRQVFWVSDQTYLMVAFAAAIATFFAGRHRNIPERLFLYPDAVGLALFTVVGTQAALQWNAPWMVASLMGVTTGVFGGIARDMLCNEIPLVMRTGELYATAAWFGTLVVIALHAYGVGSVNAAWAGMATVLLVRLAAMHFRITLPSLAPHQTPDKDEPKA